MQVRTNIDRKNVTDHYQPVLYEGANTICGIIVTYNRGSQLINCLKAVKRQNRSVNAIIIVNNASSDETEQLLFKHRYLRQQAPDDKQIHWESEVEIVTSEEIAIKIIYIRLAKNTGGAGGFYVGQKIAFNRGYEWLWLMDDDGKPGRQCLSQLLSACRKNKLAATNPLVIDVENRRKLSFGLSKHIQSVSEAYKFDSDGVIHDVANPFNGTLLHYKAIKAVGFIKKEMFIWGDESEYFWRLKSNGYVYATVTNAHFFHPPSKTKHASKLFGLLKVETKPKNLEMNFYRNKGYINGRYGRFVSHRFLVKLILFFLLEGNFRKVVRILSYYYDGYFDTYKLKNILE